MSQFLQIWCLIWIKTHFYANRSNCSLQFAEKTIFPLPVHLFFWHQNLFIHMHVRIFLFSSLAQSCQTLCDPMDCSTPGFSVHHQLPELAQTHVHRVSDAIQSSHPLSSLSPPAFSLSQHQGLFQ